MFLPTTPEELKQLGWSKLDIILVTGDTYIDSPFTGAALIGKYLLSKGFRTGIIAQPDIKKEDDIMRLGEPQLFWGVTGGSVDSMVANYTASDKWRKQDDFTPGGENNRRPDRAVIAYANLIRRFFKNTRPIVLGGMEASLRRICHYDYWSNSVRRPILFDAKADYLVYGMGEKTALELATALASSGEKNQLEVKAQIQKIKGLCYICNSNEFHQFSLSNSHQELPSYEKCSDTSTDAKINLIEMFHTFYNNNDALTARGLFQKTGDRYLVQNPPQDLPDPSELDSCYNLPFERNVHPYYSAMGKTRALETIQFSITTHRGCYGECNFCAITVHQGRTISSRSEESIEKEAKLFLKHPEFKGIIHDVGGPTANMYGFECSKKIKTGICDDKRCVFPQTCETLKPDHHRQIKLLKKLSNLPGIKHVFVASGIRYDLILDDEKNGYPYLRELAQNHTSGQLKIAPEHTEKKVLKLMGKPENRRLGEFVKAFHQVSLDAGKKQFLTYYFIAAHPGCSEAEMRQTKEYVTRNLSLNPEQVQIYTPTPSTWSSIMYYTEMNPFKKSGKTYETIFVEKNITKKIVQKEILTNKKR